MNAPNIFGSSRVGIESIKKACPPIDYEINISNSNMIVEYGKSTTLTVVGSRSAAEITDKACLTIEDNFDLHSIFNNQYYSYPKTIVTGGVIHTKKLLYTDLFEFTNVSCYTEKGKPCKTKYTKSPYKNGVKNPMLLNTGEKHIYTVNAKLNYPKPTTVGSSNLPELSAVFSVTKPNNKNTQSYGEIVANLNVGLGNTDSNFNNNSSKIYFELLKTEKLAKINGFQPEWKISEKSRGQGLMLATFEPNGSGLLKNYGNYYFPEPNLEHKVIMQGNIIGNESKPYKSSATFLFTAKQANIFNFDGKPFVKINNVKAGEFTTSSSIDFMQFRDQSNDINMFRDKLDYSVFSIQSNSPTKIYKLYNDTIDFTLSGMGFLGVAIDFKTPFVSYPNNPPKNKWAMISITYKNHSLNEVVFDGGFNGIGIASGLTPYSNILNGKTEHPVYAVLAHKAKIPALSTVTIDNVLAATVIDANTALSYQYSASPYKVNRYTKCAEVTALSSCENSSADLSVAGTNPDPDSDGDSSNNQGSIIVSVE